MAKFGLGQPMRRSEDGRFLTGHGQYTDDIVMPGQAFAHFLRSPHAHAEIESIDVSAAAAAEGVIGVLTGADLEAAGLGHLKCYAELTGRNGTGVVTTPRPALAVGRVRHVGDPVAVVIADSALAAKDASELIDVRYRPLPSVVDTAGAIEGPAVWPQAPDNVAFDWEFGQREKAERLFDQAAHVVSVDLVNNRVVPSPMEPRACAAAWDEATGRYTIYVGSQGVHGLHDQFANDIFKLPKDRFLVRTPDVGGGFGMKTFMYPEYPVTMFAAKTFGRPVKWMAERTESFLSDDHGRDNVTTVELALDADYKFLALRVDMIANMGAYLSQFGPFIPTLAGGAEMLNGLYTLQAAYERVRGVYTNTQPVDAYRGAGRPETSYSVERVVDAAARDLGIDPVELRLRNFVPPSAMPYKAVTGITFDSGDFARNLNDAVARADRAGFEARRAEAARKGKLRGMGIATYVEVCGGAPGERARVSIEKSGAVTLYIGTQSNGQGHETTYKQILAEHLGVDPDSVTMIQGDSDLVASGNGTGGSRSIPVGGAALRDGALKIQEKARLKAAEILEAAAVDIEFRDGQFMVVGTDRGVALAEIAARSEAAIAFDETGDFVPPEGTYPNGAHICELEIDAETGTVEILRYTVVDDFGRVMNPLLVAGQVHGGIVQGLGQALLEHTVYDPETGQLLSASFMDYQMPRAADIVSIDFTYNEIPCTTNPLGIKGAGEAGAIGAPPSIISAIVDALSPYGVRHVDMPATPEKLWRIIQEGRAGTPLAAE